jgi:hypothetical protein
MISKVLLISAAVLVTLSLYSLFAAILQDSHTSGILVFADHGAKRLFLHYIIQVSDPSHQVAETK